MDIAQLRQFFFITRGYDPWGFEYFSLLNPIKSFIRQEWKSKHYDEAVLIQLEAGNNMMINLYIKSKYIDSKDVNDVKQGLNRIDYELLNYLQILKFANWQVTENPHINDKNLAEYLFLVYGVGSSLSRYFYISGLFHFGIPITKQVINAAIKLNYSSSVIDEYRFLASYQERIHDFEGAKKTKEKLIEFGREHTDPEISAKVSWVLGDISEKSKKLSDAISHYKDAANYFRSKINNSAKFTEDILEQSPDFYRAQLGAVLGKIGDAYMNNKMNEEALPFFLEAVSHIEICGDHPNIGVINHQLAKCYDELNDSLNAIPAYIKATNSFVELGYTEYISNSMGNLGQIVSDSNFNDELYNYFTEEIITLGLNDLEYSVRQLFNYEASKKHRYLVVGKFWGIIRLVSYTSSVKKLSNWATEFSKKFVKLLEDNKQNNLTNDDYWFIFQVHLMIELAFCVGDIALTKNVNDKKELAHLCCVCSRFGEIEREIYKPFEWIASLLRYWKIYPLMSADKLFWAIEAAHYLGEDHSTFSLS